uniref:Lipocalin n=1 Tax=Rhipicephalus zambeziensis TaxID=60191 RepID=A0A224YNF7_9ACAR
MATFTVLILWALIAVPIATDGLFPIPAGPGLNRYHEPWMVVKSSHDVYLFHVSDGLAMYNTSLCIRSRIFQSTAQKTAVRSLDFYSRSEGSTGKNVGEIQMHGTRSINISIDAHLNDEVDVNVTYFPVANKDTRSTDILEKFITDNLAGAYANDVCIGQYKFSVLFADNKCLLLQTRYSEYSVTSINTSSRFCSLWIPEFNVMDETKCCLYLFYILCGRGVQVFHQSCLQTKKTVS